MIAPATPPPLARLGVVGLGLIGGSVARRAREVWPGLHVVGVDPVSGQSALSEGVVDERCASMATLPPVDLLVLATPVEDILTLLHDADRDGVSTLVTDVGSTKRTIVAAARQAGLVRFVGGHPVAGAAQGGLAESRADLFERRPWAVVPDGALEADVEFVSAFARALGARPVRTTAVEHDRAMAFVSHLPQLVSVWLTRAAAAGGGPLAAELAGRAMDDMTRLAASPPDLWTGILRDNEDLVRAAVAAFGEQVAWPAAGLPARLHEMFAGAAAWRETLAAAGARERGRE